MDTEKTIGALRQFNEIYREMEHFYNKYAADAGISPSAHCILYDMHELGDGCLQVDLCRTSFLSKQTVHSSVRKLEQEGALQLVPKGRGVQLFLTEKGKQMMEEKILPVIRAERAALRAMGEEQTGELLRLYRLFLSTLQQEMNKTTQNSEDDL